MKKANPSNKFATKYLFTLVFCTALSASLAYGYTSYFYDDFENGSAKWETGGDSFQVTDLFCHSPGHCASDSPEGNYPLLANSTMTTKLRYRIDLSGSTQPILMFWHKIGVYGGDYGYIEISEDYGLNWTALTSFTNQWRSTWSREIVDLSAYKSSTILIRFRLRDDGGTSHGNPTVTWGWEIDDVEVRELDDGVTLPFPFFDDFESGSDNWRFGSWQLTESFYRNPTHCMSDSDVANYPQNACSDLILAHPIDLTKSVWPVLDFWHKIGVNGGDYGRIEISQDGGLSWQPLDPDHPGRGAFTNLWYANWTPETFDLSAYRSTPILIRFRLRDDGGTSYGNPTVTWGWDIDDVMIRELVPDPRPLKVQITNIDTSNCPEIQATVIVTDMNDEAITNLDASNFSVYENNVFQTPITVELSTSCACVCLALDYSGSMSTTAIKASEDAASVFVGYKHPGDRYEIIKFARGVEVMEPGFTDDNDVLLDAIHRPPTLDRTATSLYDAIHQAILNLLAEPLCSNCNKAVIAMSDGADYLSEHSATEVINLALSEGIPIFTIGLGSQVDEDILRMIAERTGGKYYYAGTPEDLAVIYEKVAGTLNTQYLVTYETTLCGPDANKDVENELNIEVTNGMAYGEGARRFHCPLACDPNGLLGNDFDH